MRCFFLFLLNRIEGERSCRIIIAENELCWFSENNFLIKWIWRFFLVYNIKEMQFKGSWIINKVNMKYYITLKNSYSFHHFKINFNHYESMIVTTLYFCMIQKKKSIFRRSIKICVKSAKHISSLLLKLKLAFFLFTILLFICKILYGNLYREHLLLWRIYVFVSFYNSNNKY